MKNYLIKISKGQTLSVAEARAVMESICTLEPCPKQLAAFLAILHTRRETPDELCGFVNYLRENSNQIHLEDLVIDTCGTGGDYSNTFNISTASALLLASSQIKVAKHGGRSITSQCGSADVLEALEIPIQTTVADALIALEKVNFTFLFAPLFNPGFKAIRSIRKALGIRTCFNLIGPLLNPAKVKRQLMGVYNKEMVPIVAKTLQRLGSKEAMVFHSQDGLDEFSIGAPTYVAHLKSNQIEYYEVKPSELNINMAPKEHLKGGTAKTNANIIKDIFAGKPGPHRECVILNSAAGFIIAGKCNTFKEGMILAKQAIDSGQVDQFLNTIKQFHIENKK